MFILKCIKVILRRWHSAKHALWRKYARLRRATVDPSVVMNGRPLIRCCRGAKLLIREGVKINTTVSSNPVIGSSRSRLCVIEPEACMEIGPHVGMSGVSITAAKYVSIGQGTILGADVLITDTDFHLPIDNWRWSNAAGDTAESVVIGRGCFVGARAMILKGVAIGDGVVVAAGAVVTKNIPDEHLAYGNPVKIRPLADKWIRKENDK